MLVGWSWFLSLVYMSGDASSILLPSSEQMAKLWERDSLDGYLGGESM